MIMIEEDNDGKERGDRQCTKIERYIFLEGIGSLQFQKLINKLYWDGAVNLIKQMAVDNIHNNKLMNRKSKSTSNKNKITMYNETLYQVQKVMQVKWIKNRQYCYIKWKGYDQTYNTWEPKEHITFCYQECKDQEKDDDPEYTQNVPLPANSEHSYHTRAKRANPNPDKLKHITQEEQQDSPEVKEIQTPERLMEITKLKRPTQPPNSDQLQLTSIQDSFTTTPSTAFVNTLLQKVLAISNDDTKQKKMAKVELQSGKISKVQYSILKKRFPYKLIQFYEEEFRFKTCKFD